MKRKIYICSALLVLFSVLTAEAQIVSSVQRGAEVGNLRAIELLQLPTLRLPAFDQDSARIAMEKASADMRLYVFAHSLPAEVDIISEGAKTDMLDGTQVWRYRVRSSGAKSLGFYFDKFVLPEGAQLYVYSTLNTKNYIGGFGAENNNPDRALPVQPICADDVVIELQAPKGSHPELMLSSVHHGVRSIRVGPYFDNPTNLRCTPEVACFPEYSEISKSVVLILVDGSALGTGVLVNNTQDDLRSLIFTAAHVISWNFSKSDVVNFSKKFIYIFGYQSPMCDGSIQPSFQHSVAGSQLLAYHPYTDTGMMELNTKLPIEYPAYYSGWNSMPNLKDSYFNIHHPRGFSKRVNLTFDGLAYISFPEKFNPATNSNYPFGENQHLLVKKWDIGTTERGSSGSPLYDSSQRVVGVLTGGTSACNVSASDQFSSLERVFQSSDIEAQKLVAALDPTGKGATRVMTGKSLGSNTNQAPVRMTNMAIPPSEKPVSDLIPQLSRSIVLGKQQGVSEVAESYRVMAGTKVYGVYVMLSGYAAASDMLKLNLYTDNATQPIKSITLPLEGYTSKNNDERFREVYVSFAQPIEITSEQNIYLGIPVATLPSTISVAHQQFADVARGRAQWRVGDRWQAPQLDSASTSLSFWIDPLLSNPQLKPIPSEAPRLRLSPIGSEEMLLTLGQVAPETDKTVSIFTLQGQLLYRDTQSGNHIILSRNILEGVGVVILHVETADWVESIKGYFPKN